MLRGLTGALVVLGLSAGVVLADQIDRSAVPPPNPRLVQDVDTPLAMGGAGQEAEPAPRDGALATSPRPPPRPGRIAKMAAAAGAEAPAQGLDLAAMMPDPAEADPPPKPKRKSKAAKAKDRETRSKKGSVCGVAAIKGKSIAPIKAKVKGCGLAEGVRVTSVSGVRLSQAATIDCDTARALNTWVTDVLQPAYGGAVVELHVAAHYVCRTRNNKKGAKVSEHGRGKAIDIAGIVLDSGKPVMVLGGYTKTMRKAHKGACGIFGTTLGPGSDGYHEDHLHLDTARHRGGAYCR